jgi:heterodisulfide reductase subunit B
MSAQEGDHLRYAFFLGCLIPTRFPQFEILAREVLPEVGIELVDVEGFACCPDPVRFRAADQFAWLVMAARNLALAQESGLPVLTLCPGCTLTLAMAGYELQKNPSLKQQVNEVLSEVGHTVDGPVPVRHFLKVLYQDVGLKRLKERVRRPLTGLRIGAHSGCHQSNPPEILEFGNPFNPKEMDELLDALGVQVVDYREKALCCGSPLTLAGALDDSLAVVKRKVEDMKRFGAEAMAVGCASCFQQLETAQVTAFRKLQTDVQLPVFHYLELLALALGRSLDEIGFRRHKIRGDQLGLKSALQEGD